MDLLLIILLHLLFHREAMWFVKTCDNEEQIALEPSEIVHSSNRTTLIL
ncbi:hypothetical protein SAMN05216278_3869 [Halopelagius longus]|uniref:Uncharacterized protein n=1 Tax=Halopelagius longus TaxID=1236180 RepID=A0A1H1GUF0_9EURY|nr:hypothetical protein SAMN05216278_3869 [Halopelagius longus]